MIYLFFINSIYTIVKLNNKYYLSWKKTPNQNIFNSLEAEGLSKKELIKIAYETGFIKRKSKKIEAGEFLELMCLESQKGSPSFNDLASRHETVY